MNQLFKNILRYITKSKFGYFAIFLLTIVSVMIFSAFSNLGITIKNIYNELIVQYDFHDMVISEKYSDNPQQAAIQKEAIATGLSELGINFRPFNSINITNTSNNELFKVIEYLKIYDIDKLKIFDSTGLPSVDNNPILPTATNFNEILNNASDDINNSSLATTNINVEARQKLVYFATKSQWSNTKYRDEFIQSWNTIVNSNYKYDPIKTNTSLPSSNNVPKYLNAMLNKSSSSYSPIIIRGQRINFDLTIFNGGIPAFGYFNDPYSYIAIISNSYLEANNKEIYSFTEFKNEILGTNNNENVESENWLNGDVKNFLDLKTNQEIDEYIKTIDSKYTININSIPYLIVGTGITPDFLYPVISFSNSIPNPKKECLVYTNANGYLRSELSFASSPHEQFLVAKYNGNLPPNQIIGEVNKLCKKNMSWPANVTCAYWYNDVNNNMNPASVRIRFISSLINIFIAISIIIASFVMILVIFTMIVFSKSFIEKNRVSLAILLSNGLSKAKIVFSISFIASFVCFLACPIGLLLGHYLEFGIFQILANYWFIPTPITMYSAMWFIFITIIPTFVMILINFVIGIWTLKDSLINLLKNNVDIKVNKVYFGLSPMFRWMNAINKYRISISFSSWTKMVFIFVLTTLTIIGLNIGASIPNKLINSFQSELDTNHSTFAIDLATPTRQGGQYFGVEMSKVGQTLKNKDNQDLFPNLVSNYAENTFLQKTYNDSPLLQNYTSVQIPTMNDQYLQSHEIIYMKNQIQLQEIMNYYYGLESTGLGIIPWNVFKSFAPENQQNESNNISTKLKEKLLSDMRPLNQAYFANNLNNFISPTDNNSIGFPKYWVVQNFANDNPNTWNLCAPNSLNINGTNIQLNPTNVGVINASELYRNGKYIFNTPENVLDNFDNFANIINSTYSTYDVDAPKNIFDLNIVQRYEQKYLNFNLFKQDALTPIGIDNQNNVFLFSVDNSSNQIEKLITNRTLLKSFMKTITLPDDSIDESNLIFDPLDEYSWNAKKYGYMMDNSKVMQVLPFTLNNNFINFVLSVYNDYTYYNNFYRIMNNFVILNNNDEPYIHVDTIYNNENIKIIGIVKSSSYITLYDNNNVPLNNILFTTNNKPNTYDIVVNNYFANTYDKKVGDQIEVEVQNHVDRFSYKNNAQSSEQILSPGYDLSQTEFVDKPTITLNIIGINNTGNGNQVYMTFENAQKILGLSTQNDYDNKSDISTTSNPNNFHIGLNNDLNEFGGFNGIFTKSMNPEFLNLTLSLYSQSGLYPGYDMWTVNDGTTNLIKSTLSIFGKTNPSNHELINTCYLANALDVSLNKLKNMYNSYSSDDDKLTNFANHIINIIANKYGQFGFLNSYETINSLEQQKSMFYQLSETIDQILVTCTTLLVLMSILIMLIISSLVINQIIRICSILQTLGYSIRTNTSIFFSIFSPSLIAAVIVSYPLILFVNKLFEMFILKNVNIFVPIPFNIWVFVIMFGFVSILYLLIYLIAMQKFKKNNLIEALKW